MYLKIIYKSGRASSNNSIYDILSQLFLLNINPDPRKRLSFEATKKLLYRLFAFRDHDLDDDDDNDNDNDFIEFRLNSDEAMRFRHLKI